MPGSAAGAEGRRRAVPAAGAAVRQAEQGAELHQRLGEVPGPAGGIESRQPLPVVPAHRRAGAVPLVAGKAAHHPHHIAVHRRGGQAKGDGADGPGGVVADAGQRPDGVIVRREGTAIPLDQELCRLLEVAGPAVIAQPLPELEQPLLRQRRQRLDIRHLPEKALVIGQRRLHPGLLEHDLREPHMVRGRVLPPGEVAAVGIVPGQQRLREPLQPGKIGGVHRFSPFRQAVKKGPAGPFFPPHGECFITPCGC